MIICATLIILIALGIVVATKSRNEYVTVASMRVVILCSLLLAISTINRVIHPIEVHSNISKFIATKATVEQARSDGVNVESAAIQHKIIESNQWLAKEQYYNNSIFGWWIPDEIDNLKPIK